MDSLVGRTVVYTKLHTGVFVKGLGELGATFPSETKTLALKMTHDVDGVFIQVGLQGKQAEILVPWANVQVVQYAKKD